MTADYVAHHAAERPDAVAVIDDGRAVSFAELRRDIHKVAGAVRALGLARGSSVAVASTQHYVHWLLLLACERLGIAAASFVRGESALSRPLLASVDLVFADPDDPTPGARRVERLAPPSVRSMLARPEAGSESLPAKSPDDPIRIVQTSGTTGVSKRFLVSRRMHDALCVQWQWDLSLNHRSRYLQTVTLGVRATFDVGSACLRLGGTLVLESRMSSASAIAAHGITHAILLPVLLQPELDRLPADFAKPRELAIVSFGAAVSELLRKRTMERLATGLYDLYGAVETGTVSAIREAGRDGFGTLCREAQAEVVDERDQPMPLGGAGRLRLRSSYMSERYIDDPETTARMFRDGWFYPGDVGVMRADGRLKILGRTDDLLNIGGQKILPAVLEAALTSHGVAGDVGLSSFPNSDGFEELYIAISDFSHDEKQIMDRIMETLRNIRVGHFRVVKLDRIPRSANGKLQRKLLKEEIARVLGLP